MADAADFTIYGKLMSGDEIRVEIARTSTVRQLVELFQQQQHPALARRRVNLAVAEQPLYMNDTLANCLPGAGVEKEVIIIARDDNYMLQEVDIDSGRPVRLEHGAGWEGDILVLNRPEACAATTWDICPDLRTNFAVEATVKPESWPDIGWRGTVVSQHGSGTGWELRLGGPIGRGGGVECVWTTTLGGHNEHKFPLTSSIVGQWHHICMVYDATASTITVYVDGVPGESKSIRGDFRPYRNGMVEVGRNPDWNDRGMVGKIRHAAVWPRGFNLEDLPRMADDRIAVAKDSEAAAAAAA